MVNDHSENERGNQQLLHGLLFLISTKDSFYAPSHGLCYTSCAALVGTRSSFIGSFIVLQGNDKRSS